MNRREREWHDVRVSQGFHVEWSFDLIGLTKAPE